VLFYVLEQPPLLGDGGILPPGACIFPLKLATDVPQILVNSATLLQPAIQVFIAKVVTVDVTITTIIRGRR
jgi:hypothetical protein